MERRLIQLLSFTLLLALIAFGYLSRKPLCINSQIVQRLDIATDRGTVTAYSCEYNEHVPYAPELVDLIQKIEPQLEQLQTLFSVWQVPTQVDLWVFGTDKNIFRIKDQTIILSANLLEEPATLKKAVLKVWYRSLTEKHETRNILLEEVFTDFVLFSIEQNSFSQVFSKARWPYVLQTKSSLCRSPWIPLDLMSGCTKAQTIDAISIRPLLSESLYLGWRNLSHQERNLVILNLGHWLKSEIQLSTSGSEVQDLATASEFVSSILNSLISTSKTQDVVYQKWVQQTEVFLRQKGFSEQAEMSSVELIFELPKKQSLDLKAVSLTAKRAIIKDPESVWLSLENEPFPAITMKDLQAQKTVWFQCEWPSTESILKKSYTTQKLLVVKTCGDVTEAMISDFAKDDLVSISEKYPKLEFVSLHLPSLKMALARDENPWLRLTQGSWKESIRTSTLAMAELSWGELNQLKAPETYQIKAPISAIEMFKINK